MIRTALFVFAIASSVFAQVGPELELAAPNLTPILGRTPRIASNGNGYFAIWNDSRGDTPQVRGTRLDATGAVVDPVGFPIAPQASAAVASAGSDYLVAYSTPSCGGLSSVIVSADGTVSAPKQIVNTNGRCIGDVQMATNGSSYLITYDTAAVLVDRSGNVLHAPFNLGTASASVASDGQNYMVAGIFTDSTLGAVATIAVSSSGDASAPTRFPGFGPGSVGRTAIAFDTDRYLVVTTLRDVKLQLTGRDGVPIGTMKSFPTNDLTLGPRATWDGNNFIVGWSDVSSSAEQLTLAVVSPIDATFVTAPAGSLIDSQITSSFDLVRNGAGTLLLRAGNDAFTVARVSEGDILTKSVAAGQPVTLAGSVQSNPDLATTANGAVAVWTETSQAGVNSVRAIALDANGAPAGSPINVATAVAFPAKAVVAWDGTHVTIAWLDGSYLWARRYVPNLSSGDAQATAIANSADEISIAGGSGQSLLAWSFNAGSPILFKDIDAAVLTATGVIPVSVPSLTFDDHHPAAAWNGSVYLVTWGHARTSPPSQGLSPQPPDDILGVRIATDGRLIDPTPKTILALSQGADAVALASNNSAFYLLFVPTSAQLSGTPPSQIYGLPINADATATPSASQPLSPFGETTFSATLAPYVDSYVAGWLTGSGHTIRPELRFVLGSAVFTLPDAPAKASTATASLTAIGRTVVLAYPRIEHDAGDVQQIVVRTFTPLPKHQAVAH